MHAHHPQPMAGGDRDRGILALGGQFHGLGGLDLAGAELLPSDGLRQLRQGFPRGEAVRVQEPLGQQGLHQGTGVAAAVQLAEKLLDLPPLLHLAHQGGPLVLGAVRQGEGPAVQGLLEEELLQGPLILEVLLGLALLHLVERRLGDVEVAAEHQLWHLAVEEGEQQGADVGAVHVRVGHQDDLVVAEVLDLELLLADARAEGLDEEPDLVVAQDLVEAGLFHVQHLAPQGQDGLGRAMTALFGAAAGGVALHQEDLAEGRILLLAVRQLARQAAPVQGPLAPGELPGLAGRLAGPGGLDGLLQDGLGLPGILLEEAGELVVDDGLDDALHLRGDEPVLGLAGKLGIRNLGADNGRQALADVLAGEAHLGGLQQVVLLRVGVDDARHGGPEALQVGAAVPVADVVGEAVERLLVGVVPLEGHLHGGVLLLVLDEDRGLVEDHLVPVEVLHEGADAPGVHEIVGVARPLVRDADVHALVQVAELTQALAQGLEAEVQDVVEDLGIGHEAHAGAPAGRGADHRQGGVGLALAEGHGVLLAVLPDREPELAGEGVHAGHAHPVEAAGHLVGVLALGAGVVELPAGVEHRHDHFRGAAALLLVDVHRDPAAIILHAAAPVAVQDHVDALAEAREGLVDGVVHHLVDHVVQAAAIVGIADVHPGALPHGLKVAQNRDVVGGVAVGFLGGVDACAEDFFGHQDSLCRVLRVLWNAVQVRRWRCWRSAPA